MTQGATNKLCRTGAETGKIGDTHRQAQKCSH